MRSTRGSACLLLLLAAAVARPAQGAGDNIFAGTQVHTIDISFSQPSYWDSLAFYYDEGLEHYMAATVTVDGVVYDSVGVRFKGNASYTHPNNKKPFRLSFDEFLGSQRWDGLKGVHLNNCWEDPTFMREKLHLDFCRDAGIPAPRANFAELSINGTLWGFYSLVEHVDKTFLTSRYGNNDGNLYKAVDGLLGGPISDFKWYGSDPSAYYSRYELKTEESPDPWTDLIAVIDSLNNHPNTDLSLPPVVNMTPLYRAIGTDLLMASLDSYAGSGRNFYAYFNAATGKMDWVVWDAGMSFGSFWGNATNYETLSITYVSSVSNRPLVSKIFSNATLTNEYLQEFCLLSSALFSSDRLFPQIDALAPIIRPYVYGDPRKMYTNEQFEANINTDITVGGHRKPGLKAFITARKANVDSQLASLGISCDVTINPGDVAINEFAADNTLIVDPAGEAEDWIELYNNTAHVLSLGGAYLTDNPSNPTKWQFPATTVIPAGGYLIVWADEDAGQEGLHASFKLSAGGERIWFSDPSVALVDSVTFGAQSTNLTMSRIPNGTGPFVQGPPTFGSRNGFTQGVVVINEFAADNTLILDPAGEAEDWIEMFNNSTGNLDLGGMYLSDSPSQHTKWQFPAGTSISPNGYLIIWADDDGGQEGLHANFKLSAGGEYVIFSDREGATVDSIAFGAQATNLTMARIPNGTGAFVQGPPTFNGFNGSGVILSPGDVAINEFMASNDSIPDPAGEYEDWIELYNNTDHEIDLSQLYLSDDYTLPTKWQFPVGTTLPTDGFLLIWADEDLAQEGVHAGFKLSAGGERIILSNVNLSVVDSTTFGAQTLNLSMARIPDGTGAFIQTHHPTPGGPNEDPTGVALSDGPPLVLALRVPIPFLPGTRFEYAIVRSGPVLLQVFDLQGRLVATLIDREMPAGIHRSEFDASALSCGLYFCRLRTAEGSLARRMLVIK